VNNSWKNVILNTKGPSSTSQCIILYLKGMLMGIADLIPGVSGGTIAFITGIYEQLLEAISSIDGTFFKCLLSFKLKEAFSRVHLKFLLVLLAGVGTSVLVFARLMHFLIYEYPIPTWGMFFGLIGASIIILGKEIESFFSVKSLFWVVLGAVLAFVIVGLIPVTTPEYFWWIFICGLIAIMAMILPGLSGSFLLLILGKYQYITGAIKNPFSSENFLILCVFAAGAITGILGFSKVLNHFLKHFRSQTIAILTGILIGSLRKVWPWKEVLETVNIRGKVKVLRDQNILPTQFDLEFSLAITLIILGFVSVLILEKYSSKNKTI
jgi:putative membrane protein